METGEGTIIFRLQSAKYLGPVLGGEISHPPLPISWQSEMEPFRSMPGLFKAMGSNSSLPSPFQPSAPLTTIINSLYFQCSVLPIASYPFQASKAQIKAPGDKDTPSLVCRPQAVLLLVSCQQPARYEDWSIHIGHICSIPIQIIRGN